MKEKAECYFRFFRDLPSRDLITIATITFLGGTIGILRSMDQPSDVRLCNFLCDSAYGAYSGLSASYIMRVGQFFYSRYFPFTNRSQYENIDDDQETINLEI